MDKPITVALKEFREGVVELVNNSGLPACMMEPVFRNLHSQLVQIAAQQEKTDEETYLASLKTEQEEERS
jgi:hypothetical protein